MTALQLLVVSDPIDRLDPRIDTTLGLIRSARARGHEVWVCETRHLGVAVCGAAVATARRVVGDPCEPLGAPAQRTLDDMDAVLFRPDPPVDRRYLDATHVLDQLDTTRTVLVNDPRGLRVVHEKLIALQFPDLIPPTVVTAEAEQIARFVADHGRSVIKPLDGHAGRGVLLLDPSDRNRPALVELATAGGTRQVIVQQWAPAVEEGNVRVFVFDGAIQGAIVRRPSGADFRIGFPDGVVDLTPAERHVVERVIPLLQAHGQLMAGLDLIGGRLIEVNVTSPGALRKSDLAFGTTLCDDLIIRLELRADRRRASTASPVRTEALIRRFWDATLGHRDLSALDDYTDVPALRANLTKALTAFPDIDCAIDRLVADARGGTVWASGRGTHLGPWFDLAPTGRVVDLRAVLGFEVDPVEDRLVGFRFEGNLLAVHQQLTVGA